MKKVLIWETSSEIAGGQKMTLTVADMIYRTGGYEAVFFLPERDALSAELDRRGIRYILLGNQTMPSGIKGKKVIFLYAGLTLKAISAALKVIRKERIDLIYAPGPAALPWSAICGKICKVPVIWHLHHIFADGMTMKLINRCSALKSVRVIVCISECVKAQLGNETGKRKCEVVYNPVDFEKYASGDGSRADGEIEEALPGYRNMLSIIQIGTLEREKRQEITIAALGELKRRGQKCCALFAGKTKPGDENYGDHLKELAKSEGVSDNVYFMGQRSDVPDLLKCIDLAFIPSLEGLSLVALEAAAAGVPVVGANIAGVRELTNAGDIGELFEYDNVLSAADAILHAAEPVRTARYRKNGPAFAVSYSEEKYAERINLIFGEYRRCI